MTERELAESLARRLAQTEEKRVVVRADREVAYDRVVRAMDVVRSSGAETLTIAVEQRDDVR